MWRRIEFSGTEDEAIWLLDRLRYVIAGTLPDTYGITKGLQLRAGVALLSQVQQDFIRKSRGGVGKDGIKWQPLKPETIAQRRITPGEWRKAGLKGSPTKHLYTRGLLTETQDLAWRREFVRVFSVARFDMSEGAAKAKAAALAWAYVKREWGAVTKLALFGNRQVDILRDTGELFRSLTPGVGNVPASPDQADGQVFIMMPGRVIVGTNKKTWHHAGIPGRLPSRPLWPLTGLIPDAWWPPINEAIATGVLEMVALLMRKAGLSK